jgi:DNA-binding CsgD family transcriptional regulator/PAS domain-containing protein
MVEIDEIYDAAFDRSKFESLLRRMVEGLGAKSGFLAWTDKDGRAGFQVQFGNDPHDLQRYVETYAQHDIMLPILHELPEGLVAPAYDHLQKPDIRESVFYREYLAPQGVVDNLAVNLIKRPGMVASLAIVRTHPAAPFSKDDTARLSALVPHLRRAVFLQSHLIRQANLVSGFRQAANNAGGGLILLDEQLRVLEINPEFEALTGMRVGEQLDRTGSGKNVTAAIRDRTPKMVEVGGDDGAVIRLLCYAQPIERDPYGDLADGPGVAFAVHVAKLDGRRPIAFPLITSLYALTPTERRVLEDAVGAGETVTMGERLGMARATTRTHLHRIYEKTGTSGLPELCLFAHKFVLPHPIEVLNKVPG